MKINSLIFLSFFEPIILTSAPLFGTKITNEKLLSTEYGDGWTLDDYEVAEHTDGHWKGMWEIQVKRITHPDSGSLGI